MQVFVVGGTGATGRLLLRELLARGHDVKVVVRSAERLPEDVRSHARLSVVEASLLGLSQEELQEHVRGSQAIASCLGHNLTLNGVFGLPHRLVTEAVRRLCATAGASTDGGRVKFVLMSSAGVRNRALDEPCSQGQRFIVGLLRILLPPHADNEAAADYLQSQIGPANPRIEWAIVRPDSLTNATAVTGYTAHLSPTRSALFNPGKTSRINVAHFMAELVTNRDVWAQWKGRMPVIYNED
ncbi:MAG: SDR family oxidoreductase [Dehalococcoidia bacterium]|nr:SDR family oxidoreductase [Dehalococcoidia bacterium]